MSCEENGIIEFWDPETFEFPTDGRRLAYELPSETDYFELPKNKTCVLSCSFN